MNAGKWTGLMIVLAAVVGVAVWSMAVPGTMANHTHQSSATQPTMGQTMAPGPNGQTPSPQAGGAGPFADMRAWCEQMWNQMTRGMSAMMGMMGGGMHGHGSGMMGQGMMHPGPHHRAPSAQNGSSPSVPSADPGETVTVQMANFAFHPGTIQVEVGQTVTWVNRDSVGHNVVFNETDQVGPMLGEGEQWSFRFDEPGTYTYYCAPHPFMTGTVVVK